MIKSIKVKNPTSKTIYYLNVLSGKNFEFSDGVNIIIGKNGSGKTSLIELIKKIFFCTNRRYPDLKTEEFEHLSYDNQDEFLKNIEITADFTKSIYSLRNGEKPTNFSHANDFFRNIELNSLSSGESIFADISCLFEDIFDNYEKTSNFQKNIRDRLEYLNFKSVDDYYNKHQLKDKQLPITILMDEPDKGLDVEHLEELYNVLKTNRKDIQLIVIIHNIALIKKLSKLNYVNIIEMSEGYLEKIKEFNN